MMLPFMRSWDADANLVLTTMFKGSPIKANTKIFPYYETSITWDTQTFLFGKCNCGCTSFIMGRSKDVLFICKHIKEFIDTVQTKYKEELE